MSYGKSWEKYPIEENQVWHHNGSMVSVNDITKGIPEYMLKADMIYCDCPWSLGNVNMFNRKAGREKMAGFSNFYNPMFEHIKSINPETVYLEIGERNKDLFIHKLSEMFCYVDDWQIKYYNKHLCYLIRASNTPHNGFDFTGIDDTETPLLAIHQEKPKCVADFCTGRGLTGIAAHKFGCEFAGTELIKRKLAVFIHRADRMGVKYERK